jgi:hypothetical protein
MGPSARGGSGICRPIIDQDGAKEVSVHIQKSSKAILLAAGAAVVLFGGLATAPAEARAFVSVGVGLPFFAPPPVVYAPPPVVYAAPPVVYAPAAPVAYAPAPAAQTCHPFQSTIQVNGQTQPSYGTVCLQPDGTWRVVH